MKQRKEKKKRKEKIKEKEKKSENKERNFKIVISTSCTFSSIIASRTE